MPYFSGDSEGEILSDWLEDGRTADDDERDSIAAKLAGERRTQLYNAAKAAKTGAECVCPSCAKKFKKKSYQQAFCSNKGANNCKDSFWNRASPDRMQRATYFAR